MKTPNAQIDTGIPYQRKILFPKRIDGKKTNKKGKNLKIHGTLKTFVETTKNVNEIVKQHGITKDKLLTAEQ